MIDFQILKEKEVGQIRLEGDLTIQFSTELKTALLEAFEKVNEIQVDLQNVTDIDLSTLQILCSAQKFSLSHEKKISLSNSPPEIFHQIFREAGFSNRLGCCTEVEEQCIYLKGVN